MRPKTSLKFESWILCRYEQKLHIATSHSSRFTGLTVGTDFDPKELMFRNYVGLISQESKIAARITFSEGEKDDKEVYTIGWLDPNGRLVVKNKLQVTMPHYKFSYRTIKTPKHHLS